MDFEALSGPEKAAILILSLPADTVRDLLGQLDDHEVQKALAAVSRMDEIPARVQDRVLGEFREALGKRDYAIAGGRKRAVELIQSGLDPNRASNILEDLGRDEKRIDWTLRAYQPQFIAAAISAEHPQTIALVVSQLPADRGAAVIRELPEEMRAEVLLRIAELESVTTDVIAEVEEGVAELFGRRSPPSARVGGTTVAADVLNRVPTADGNTILDGVGTRDPEVAGAIRRRMLTFNDLHGIDRRGFQTLLREISTDDLAVALKTADDEMKEKVFLNVSSRAAEQIKEEVELLGPMKLSEVEAVQEQIVETARRLAEEGRLTIDLGSSDDVLV